MFVQDGEAEEGETVLVVCGHQLTLGRVRPDGGVACEEDLDAPEVLGRYAGHAGPFGVVRHLPLVAAGA